MIEEESKVDYMNILREIFHFSNNNSSEIFPILKNSDNIQKFKAFVDNKNNNNEKKIILFKNIKNIFEKNNLLIFLFTDKYYKKSSYFFYPLINIYLSEETKEENLEFFDKFIYLINSHISLNQAIFEFIFQKLSKFFGNRSKKNLTNSQFIKYLRLLKIFFKDTTHPIKNDNMEKEEINNYIYFNGYGSGLIFFENKQNLGNIGFPSLENGFSIIFWIKIESELLKYYNQIYPNVEVNLIKINIGKNKIILQLNKEKNTFKLQLISNSDVNNFETPQLLTDNKWNYICFVFNPKEKDLFKIHSSSYSISYKISIPKNFPLNQKIDNIKLFENFLGKISSLLFFSFPLNQNQVNLFGPQLSYLGKGFYKNKILFRFLNFNQDNYLDNSINYKYRIEYENEKIFEKYLSLESKDKNEKNIISLFCPFAYYKETNQLDDIFGNYTGILSKNDGVIYFTNYYGNLQLIGGVDNLLPIAELMYSSIQGSPNPSYTQVTNDLLAENTLFEYLSIIEIILHNHHNNLKYFISNNFFQILSVFLERYPKKVFSDRIFNIILEIGIEILENDFGKLPHDNSHYINCILLNEEIFSKFSEESQIKLWQIIYKLSTDFPQDALILKNFFDTERFCRILRFYDKERYELYCCQYHANLFSKTLNFQSNNKEQNQENNIIKPDLNKILEFLIQIIQIYINKLIYKKQIEKANKLQSENDEKSKKNMSLYQLLSLDISPCLQKSIIQIYINHFKMDDSKIPKNSKITTFNYLMENDFIEITEYVMSISFIDVRIKLIDLFIIIIDNYFEKLFDYENERFKNFIQFIGENICPKDLKIALDSISTKDDINIDKNSVMNNYSNNDQIKRKANTITNKEKKGNFFSEIYLKPKNLVKYFNTTIYEKETSILNQILVNWIGSKENKQKMNNPIIIDLFINFGKHLSFDYIEKLSIYLTNALMDEINNNKNNNSPFEDKANIYYWIIDTIFYFKIYDKSKQIAQNIKENILSITFKLFKKFFSVETSENYFSTKMKYLINYIYYAKNFYKNEKEKIQDLHDLVRELFLIIFEFSNGDINMKTIANFEFMFLYKNSEKLLDIIFKTKHIQKADTFSNIENTKDFMIKNDIINENDINTKLINFLDTKKNSLENQNLSKTQKNINSQIDFFPEYIIKGLYLNESLNNKEKNANKDNINLNNIWNDFLLCKSILNKYQDFWGMEHLYDKLKMQISEKWEKTIFILLEKYGNKNSKNKISLIDEISKLLNLTNEIPEDNNFENNNINKKNKESKLINNPNEIKKDSIKPNQNSINILYINLILLSIQILLAKDKTEKITYFIEYQQFLIFCVLSSINLNYSIKNYDIIQDILYNALGYGFSFLKVSDEDIYKNLINDLIVPIIEEINTNCSKINLAKMFFITKEILYKKTAVYKLFISEISLKKEKSNDKKFPTKDEKDLNDSNKEEIKNDNKKSNSKNKVYFEFKGDINEFINNIFNTILEGYKNLRKVIYIDELKKYYLREKDNGEEEDIVSKSTIEEKKLIEDKIKELIPFIEAQIKEKSNLLKNEEIKQKNIEFKKIKKKLFSWRGFWSDRYLFFSHPEYLKLKIKNHFTKEMFKPVLSPVLDIKYYIPNFKSFDKNNLFNENDYKYYINLNLNEILGEKKGNQKSSNHKIINTYGFNYIEAIYKYNYEKIWELYNHNENFQISINEANKINIVTNQIIEGIKDKEKSKDKQFLIKNDSFKEPNENFIILDYPINLKYIKCCLVKSSHHIKGNIIPKNDNFVFIPEDNNDKTEEEFKKENEEDPNFDKISGCCFGSYFKLFPKDKQMAEIVLEYCKIQYIFFRVYFYYESALEIYCHSNKSYYFNFKTKEEMNTFLDILLKNCPNCIPIKTDKKRILGYIQRGKPKEKDKGYYISKKTELWQNYQISTLEYLMWLNIYGGRSFNDVNQYPVFPWIITNYKSKELDKTKRDFSLPIGMMIVDDYKSQSEERKKNYLEVYENNKDQFENLFPNFNFEDYLKKGEEYYHYYNNKMKIKEEKSSKNKDKNNENICNEFNQIQINQIPYIFGSHYSNPIYISHYLVRIFPFSFISIQIIGNKFDDADRMFTSISKTFENVCTLQNDVREIIPEFYTAPEIFMNKNNLNLAQGKKDKDGKVININDVILPPWSENNSGIFVSKMRIFLENNSDNINKWIDLIFGFNQRGEKADSANNLFSASTYERMIKIEEVKNPDLRESLMRFVEVGITPFKIFNDKTKERINKNEFIKKFPIYYCYEGSFLEESTKLVNFGLNFNLPEIKNPDENEIKIVNNSNFKIIGIKHINAKNSLFIFTNMNYLYEIKLNSIKNLDIKEAKFLCQINNNSSEYSCSYIMSNLKKIPFVVYENFKYIIKGGFWDGRLELNSINLSQNEPNISKCFFSYYQIPITILKMYQDEKYLFCGNKLGMLIVYAVKGPNLVKKIIKVTHTDEITDISFNYNLNMFASVSKDGYLLLYIVPNFKLIRVLKISNLISRNKTKNLFNNKNENMEKMKIKSDEKSKSEKNNQNIFQTEEEDDNDINEESDEIYADNIFLSSSPLPCITIYISKMKLFLTYTINGEFVSEQKEKDKYGSNYITSSKLYKNLTFQEFLIYGTDKGIVKIRRFPDMNLVGDIIKVTNGTPIEILEISEDKRFCYVWSEGSKINIIKDFNTSFIQIRDYYSF